MKANKRHLKMLENFKDLAKGVSVLKNDKLTGKTKVLSTYPLVIKTIARKVYMLRTMMNMSQRTLAEGLGVSIQQVQKYERGVNSFSIARLMHVANILNVSLDYFYSDLSSLAEVGGNVYNYKENNKYVMLVEDELALKIAFNVMKIKDEKLRESLLFFSKNLISLPKHNQ